MTQSISGEQNQSFSMDDFAKALEQYDYDFTKGQEVHGKVVEHSSDGVYVDIGGKSPGFVPLQEVILQEGKSLADVLPLQHECDFLIISEQNSEGEIKLSMRQLQLKQAWEKVEELSDNGASVQMLVTGSNKGGVTGEVEGLRAFIPRSHLVQKENLESLVDQWLTANFLEVDPERQKLVLSQRQLARAAAISQLAKGTVVAGKIVKIQPYGVFVELGGITGLLHITQISNNRVESLSTLFQIGQEIKVLITEVDELKNRISLSTRLLEEYPGEMLQNMAQVMENAEERGEKAQEKLSH